MAISFPRNMPADLLTTGLEFLPEPMHEIAPQRSGRQIALDLGPTLWRAKYSADTLDIDAFDELRAWYSTLLSTGQFYGYDRARPMPRLYENGFDGLMVGLSAFTGSCILEAVNESTNVDVVLSGLPVGFQLSVGDYFCFDYSTDSRALHRCVAAATADGGGEASVEVRPHIRPGWEPLDPYASCVVSLNKPAARMVIMPGSYSEALRSGARIGSISFEAIQSL